MAPPPYEFTERFRSNLRRWRRITELSQEHLALLASMHRTEIGLLEGGKRTPRTDTLIKLAGSLEVQPNDLLDGIEWIPDRRSPKRGVFWVPQPLDGHVERRADG
jgi:transcriptional regulator with XRE-family HTH domain